MKRITKLLLASLIFIFAFSIPVFAGSAVKVEKQMSSHPIKLLGKDKSGKTVWTYNCEDVEQTELCSVSHLIKGKFVYVIDNDQFVRLRLKDGKEMNRAKLPQKLWDAAMAVDDSGYLYAIGYYGADVFKIGKKGKVVWKTALSDEYIWPYKIKLKGKKLQIFFEGEGSPESCTLLRKNGKMTK